MDILTTREETVNSIPIESVQIDDWRGTAKNGNETNIS